MTRVWLIIGATSGFGEEITKAALAVGDRVVATGRRPEAMQPLVDEYQDAVLPMRLDVTDADQARTVLADAVSALGRVDVVVNNASYGHIGAVEELDDREVRELAVLAVQAVTTAAPAVLTVVGAVAFGLVWGGLLLLQRRTLEPLRGVPRFPTPSAGRDGATPPDMPHSQ
jgi:NADP-dependent 3-hydroxy acid dehydrogenase YdfG